MDAKIITTIGELIQDKRRSLDMTITQLSELSGIPRGTISRIENGEVKRPEFSSVHLLATALGIPFETLVDYYAEIEKRAETLLSMLQTTVQQCEDVRLICRVATKYLESPNEDSVDLTEKLYQNIDSIEDTSIKLSLYNLIIEHSRSHGIMPYIAKGLYQRYLIERYDFSRFKETYYSGKYVLNYLNFLSHDQQIDLYYRLGIQAFNLRLYHESIELCKSLLKYDSENPHKVNAVGILRDAYFKIEDYIQSELYSLQYKQFKYSYTNENVILMEALFSVKKGDVEQAVEQLTELLETCSNDSAVLATNHLLQLYLQQGSLKEAGSVLNNCRVDQLLISNPLVQAEYAEFLSFQGEYFLAVGDFEKSITCMLDGAFYYSQIDDIDKERECLSRVMQIQLEHNLPSYSTFEKLNSYYIKSKRTRRDEHEKPN